MITKEKEERIFKGPKRNTYRERKSDNCKKGNCLK
jgi:hypothetical protein